MREMCSSGATPPPNKLRLARGLDLDLVVFGCSIFVFLYVCAGVCPTCRRRYYFVVAGGTGVVSLTTRGCCVSCAEVQGPLATPRHCSIRTACGK